MSYYEAIEANGVKIAKYQEFGSCQGEWIAKLEDGRYVEGSYGSCSGCDAFEAEFGYDYQPTIKGGKYYVRWGEEVSKSEYDNALQLYNQKLKDFGAGYLSNLETKDEIVKRYEIKCAEENAWDGDREILEWLKNS